MIPRYTEGALRESADASALSFTAAALVAFADAGLRVALGGAVVPSVADALFEISDRARRLAGHAQARAGSLIADEALGGGERE
jgi:hypothetical protein